MKGTVTVKEADRAAVVMAVVEKRLKQREAAERLGLSVRQVKRLAKRYRAQGAAGMASARRGSSNRAFGEAFRREALGLVRERYADFGPTLAAEKLLEEHGLAVSRETLRKWMSEEGLWHPKGRREARVHQSRPRHERPGAFRAGGSNPRRVFHRFSTAAFRLGGSRPWKSRGKRYSARPGESLAQRPEGRSELGKGDISKLHKRGHF